MNEVKTSARCFKRPEQDADMEGYWIMTHPTGSRGVFYRRDFELIEIPGYTVEQLTAGEAGGSVEVSPEEVLKALEDWPEARQHALQVFARHPEAEYQSQHTTNDQAD